MTLPISAEDCPSFSTVWVVLVEISRIDTFISSAPVATVATLREISSAAAEADAVCLFDTGISHDTRHAASATALARANVPKPPHPPNAMQVNRHPPTSTTTSTSSQTHVSWIVFDPAMSRRREEDR
jgi:hypothetical protein